MSKITFFDMPLSDGMKQTINNIGFVDPTPIQEQSIPELLQGRDLLGQAQTGTGKTGAFSIPLIELVDDKKDIIQAMVVCPTRELCLQVCQEIKRLSAHKNIETVALYGGQAIDQQFRSLKFNKPQIIVATPGRLFDHLRRKSVELSNVSMIVLDEADEMLDMGFRPEIEQIFDLLPEQNQRIFFSATMPKAIKDLACTYLRDPRIIKTESKSLTASKITQAYFKVRGKEKTELLCRVLDMQNPKLAVVFCNAKSTVDELVEDINIRGFEAGVLHGDLSQNQRDRVMAKFKTGQVRVLVATDVAARGIDIDDIELVLNYHLPHDPEDYVHRIGRTGRAGRSGRAVSLVEPRDNSRLRRICQFAKVDILEETPPSIADVKKAKLSSLVELVETALTSEKIGEYRAFLAKQKLSAEDIAVGMLQLSLKKFDESAQGDEIFEDLRERKYANSSPRFRGDRGGRTDRRDGYAGNGGRGPREYRGSREESEAIKGRGDSSFGRGDRGGYGRSSGVFEHRAARTGDRGEFSRGPKRADSSERFSGRGGEGRSESREKSARAPFDRKPTDSLRVEKNWTGRNRGDSSERFSSRGSEGRSESRERSVRTPFDRKPADGSRVEKSWTGGNRSDRAPKPSSFKMAPGKSKRKKK